MVIVKVPKNTASVVLHTKVESAKFHQKLASRRAINFPPNVQVALYTDCREIEIECEGPSELEWFP